MRQTDTWRAALAVLLLAGCAAQSPHALDRLLDQAVRDLRCQPADITLSQESLDGGRQRASGCGRVVLYTYERGAWLPPTPLTPAESLLSWSARRRGEEICDNQRVFAEGVPLSDPTDCPFDEPPDQEAASEGGGTETPAAKLPSPR
jgi:hypothetical protein